MPQRMCQRTFQRTLSGLWTWIAMPKHMPMNMNMRWTPWGVLGVFMRQSKREHSLLSFFRVQRKKEAKKETLRLSRRHPLSLHRSSAVLAPYQRRRPTPRSLHQSTSPRSCLSSNNKPLNSSILLSKFLTRITEKNDPADDPTKRTLAGFLPSFSLPYL